ncbi:MAG TPA: AAA family ATPase [Lacipirellulaceae bacterium]|nr:AAA family ATPase [Lacipirellulaceae bacterium]
MPTTPAGLDLQGLLTRGERVFPACPQVGRYFPAASIEDARRRVGRAIDRGDGPCLIVGGPGTGKSLLLQVLAAQYHEQFDVVLLACAPLRTRRALLQAILFELGLPHRITGEGDLRLSLLDHLLSAKESPSGLLLLVDEAQSLSPGLLDELRVMTNLVRGGAPRVRLVLAGSAALEESFAHVELESFSQRLSARCYLAPMTRKETSQYIRAQIAASDADPNELIAVEAAAAVFEATDGVPRLVNQLCDRALVMAEAQNLARIDRNLIQAAWSDLQQLPTPWETPSSTSAAATSTQVVEFGQLRVEPMVDDELCEDMAEIEPTELDVDDVLQELPMPSEAIERAEAIVRDPANPFGEQFDEEEVVLDNFAAWDNMFLRARIRVENRRDPGFASMVQDAINASTVAPLPVENQATETPAARLMPSPPEEAADSITVPGEAIDEFVDECSDSDSGADDEQNVPLLRLAVVPELLPLTPIPLISAAQMDSAGDAAFDPVLPEDEDIKFGDWFNRFAAEHVQGAEGSPESAVGLLDEEPILVIEDETPDQPARKPQARRQEYRQLFSRLRSG